ncbi:hypothetical protein AFLA_011699 [Aspergillus flavus NRRL3357]|nr:hypothetical protein AFLA_011699 [Aspergillus flavus NRRL3357]
MKLIHDCVITWQTGHNSFTRVARAINSNTIEKKQTKVISTKKSRRMGSLRSRSIYQNAAPLRKLSPGFIKRPQIRHIYRELCKKVIDRLSYSLY